MLAPEDGDPEDLGVELPQVWITTPLTSQLADLESIRSDVVFARDCLLELGEFQRDQKTTTFRALWSAGAISFRRAFTSGRALILPGASRLNVFSHIEAQMTPEQRAAHETLIALASKHVAHRVSDAEQSAAPVFLQPPPGRGIAGTASFSMSFIGPREEEIIIWLSICDLWVNWLDQQIHYGRAAFDEWVRSPDFDLDRAYDTWSARGSG